MGATSLRYGADRPRASSPRFLLGPASCIDDGHWQSGAPLDLHLLPGEGFHAAVLCALPDEYVEWGVRLPSSVSGLEIFCSPMEDAEIDDRIVHAAWEAAAFASFRLAAGRKVLVSCIAGKNRSGLVSALALMERRGMSGREAVARVRSRRPIALDNASFRRYVESL